MKRFVLTFLVAVPVLFSSGTASGAPKIPDFPIVPTFKAKIHVAGGVTVTSTHDTTDKCTPGQAWTMTESVDLEINDKVIGNFFGKNKISSRFATGNVEQKSGIRGYRTTNNCPPTAKVELEEPDCDSYGGRSLANLVPDGRFNGGMSIAMTRRGGGSQDLSCMAELPINTKIRGAAVTPLAHVFTPINLPLNVPVKKFKKLNGGDRIIRQIRISGQCERVSISTGGPGIEKLAADPTCTVDGLFNVIVKKLND